MTYEAASELGDSLSSDRAPGTATVVDGRVAGAIVACQTFLVVRILSVLVCVSLLPTHLPSLALRLDATHVFVLPLSGINPADALLGVTAVSAIELYLVYRLVDRLRLARFGVLVIESGAIVAATIALAFGASFAILPLAASVGATCLLLLNRVRWAFLLQPRARNLTGRRQGGTFAGYAAPSLDSPKAPQQVGYLAQRIGPSTSGPATPAVAPQAAWGERTSTRPHSQGPAAAPDPEWTDFAAYRVVDAASSGTPRNSPSIPGRTTV